MPLKPLRPCTHPGCGTLDKGGKCSKHRTETEQRRGSAVSRGYNYRWQKARDQYLAEHPLCRECEREGRTEPATDVDHIIPHHGDATLFWDRGNWQGLCHSHHSAKTWRGE